MTEFDDVRAAPRLTGHARGVLRWICTNNPFYVISAGLFLVGMRVSFWDQSQEIDNWALMSGLAGYTLLLAVTAFLLVRFCNIWDDVRTILLLVVLMFLATSLTFDEVLVNQVRTLNPMLGYTCYLGGLAFAIVVSEGLLRGIRLRLPAGFRVPYYLLLALFFLYPLALSPLLTKPPSDELLWGLFGFSSVAGLIFLTLLPAIRRGPEYIRNNGSPWPWPLYPWTLFGVFAGAVPVRAFLLCLSMHLLEGAEDKDRLIFGPYFLVPFGLALTILLLEIGLTSNYHGVIGTALLLPAALIDLALVGHQPDPVYQEFVGMFVARLGGDPLYLTLLAVAGFYFYAVVRGVPLASELLTGTLAALTVVGPNSLIRYELISPQWLPILLAALLQLVLGLWARASWRCLVGAGGLVAVVALLLPETSLQGLVIFHLALLAVLIIGAAFNDALARLLRFVGAGLVFLAAMAAMFVRVEYLPTLSSWLIAAYPLVMAEVLVGYGLLLRMRAAFIFAALILACWLTATGWRTYFVLRQFLAGLDYLVLALVHFALAFLISLSKAGMLSRWLAQHGRKEPNTTG